MAHAYEGVVDGGVAVRVIAAHGVADYPGALAVRGVGTDPHPEHGVQDPTLYRLEAVANVGDGPGGDDREGVGEEGLLQFLLDGDVNDLACVVHFVGDEFLLLGHGAVPVLVRWGGQAFCCRGVTGVRGPSGRPYRREPGGSRQVV